MTDLLEAPPAPAWERTDAAPLRRGGWSRWRVASRLAHRQVRRTWLSSLLVIVLVALPIAGMSGFIVFADSMLATPAEKVRAELGEMEAWIAPAGVPDAGFWQAPTQPDWNGYPTRPDGSWEVATGSPLDDPTIALPPGTETVMLANGTARVETATGIGFITAWTGEAWDPRLEGAFHVVAGERPDAAGEAMVTPAALERLGIVLGGDVRLSEGGGAYTVVGTMEAASLPDAESAVFLPAAAADAVGGERRWYLPGPALSWAHVEKLNEQGVVAYSREVALDPPAGVREEVRAANDGWWASIWPMVIVLIVAGLFAAYVVVMLAGAAFAVAARRQQHALAVAASVGAAQRDLSRTILLQGTALGSIGGVVGVAAGIGVAALAMRLTDDGSATRYWGFHVPWVVVAGILLFAVLVGTASALVPARTVSRTDPLSALRGARRPQKPRASRPIWGSLLLLAGIATTIACALAVPVVNASDLPWDSPLRNLPVWGIVIGPILAQIGIVLSGRWLLWLVSRGLSRVGTAPRLAARDAAANASRTVPAFAAIAATVFLGVFAIGEASMQSAQTARAWFYDAPLGSLAITLQPNFGQNPPVFRTHDTEDAARTAVDLAADGGASRTAVVRSQRSDLWAYADVADIPDDATFALAILPDEHLLDPEEHDSWSSAGQDPSNPISVVEPKDVETALGIDLTASELAAYRDGAAVAADPRFVANGSIDVAAWARASQYEGRVPDNIWLRSPAAPALDEPLWERTIPALSVEAPRQPIEIAIAPSTADELGIASQPERIVASFDEPVPTADRDRLRAQAALASTSTTTLIPDFEDGPASDAAWMVPLLVAVSVLVLGASGVALGLARFERRPDDATLAAIGGTRALRRGIGFWQGLIIAGFGTIAGAAVGILPFIGFSIQSGGTQQLGDVPWGVIGGLALVLPLSIAAVNWLVPPRRPDLTRRTAIT